MNQSEFERLALTYGAGLHRWPAQYQVAARRLLETHPELRRTLAGVGRLDASLEGLRASISEQRLARVKSATFAHVAPVRATAFRAWMTSFANDLAPVTLGTVSALCLAWFVHHERMLCVTQEPPSVHLDVVSALIDYDSAIFREQRL